MKYLSIVFFVIMYSGLILLAGGESAIVFFFASVLMSVVAIYNVYKYVKNPADICLFDFFATSLLLAYALSSLTTQVKVYSLKSIDVAHYFSLNQYSLSVALASVAFASAVLFFLSKLFPAKIELPVLSQKQIREGLWMIIFVTGSAIYCIATGLMQFQGIIFINGSNQSISPFASMVYSSIVPAGILAIFLASGGHDISHFNRRLLYALAIVLWLITFSQARRMLVYMVFLYLIFYSFDGSRRPLWRKKVLFSAAVIPIAYLGVKLFYAIRIATWELPPDTNDFFQLFKIGLDIFSNPGKYDFDYLLAENSLDRPFVLRYLAQIIDKINFGNWFSGKAVYATLLITVPSAFIGMKHFLVDEELIHPKIGLPVNDEANTILTAGIVDFGWIGLLLFPVFVLVFLKCLLFLVKKSNIGWFSYFTMFSVLTVILNIENSMAQYWSLARSTLILLVLILSIKYLMNTVLHRR
ncbi:hypothetical protein [Polaromonas sp.]|uniref:hypothetical protein n=1 Tax=Polaromonas sp. TaxID=1869339 RepID=UPI0013BC1F3D|nr:hypothetical protein [Polaromonas sp.]NDP61473.1 hypothetical protein [Polaromonas sp.]